MVAASKMRKAQAAAIASRPYAQELARLLLPFSDLPKDDESFAHPLLQQRSGGRELVLLIATDKGLCGALNTNLLREVAQFDPANTDFVCVGKKGLQFLVRTKCSVLADFEIKDSFTYFSAESVAKFCMDQFLSGKVNRVSVLYTNFVNTLTQKVDIQQLVPVRSFDIGRVELSDGDGISDTQAQADTPEYILEPNQQDFLGSLLPHFIFFKVFHFLLEARASEHSARMVAMKSATDNAKQLIKDLTLEYNKVRQASITTEILEIATAQMVLS